MTYPPAPWQLQGYALQTLQLVDVERASNWVPSELEIVSLLPGKTLGGIYLSSYETGSLLQYNELIVVAASVRDQGKIGVWISHIYVDNEDSVAGGREIWGLPKEMAEFTWEKDSVRVRQHNCELCHLHYQKGLFSFSTPGQIGFNGSGFSGLGTELMFFNSHFKSRVGLVKGSLEIPQESPFANLNFSQPWLTLNMQQLELLAGVPEIVGNKSPNLIFS
jgi:acetoacetate decarboxylase